MHKKSAAHKTLPLGTYVEVLNLKNKRRTVIRINDRGPFVKGRIIDLSYAAAKEIALIGPGTGEVRISALGKEVGKENSGTGAKPLVEINVIEKGEFTIQIGSFKEKENAAKLADRLRVIFKYVNISEFKKEANTTYYRLHVSKTETLSNAGKVEKKLEDMGFTEAFIVRL
jgi:rare lipoprotein A